MPWRWNCGVRRPSWMLDPSARNVCSTIGNQKLRWQDGVKTLLQVRRKFFAPGAAESAYQDATQFSRRHKAAEIADAYLVGRDCFVEKRKDVREIGVCARTHSRPRCVCRIETCLTVTNPWPLPAPAPFGQCRRLRGKCIVFSARLAVPGSEGSPLISVINRAYRPPGAGDP